MRVPFRTALAVVGLFVTVVRAADEARPFSQTLSPAQQQALGLASLTPEQRIALDAAIAAYARGEKTVAVAAAVQQVERQAEAKVKQAERKAEEKVKQAEQKAAETAVEDYKKKSEPGVIARTLEKFKRNTEDAKVERITARVVGEFRGWRGGTYFPLENGQVWRQASDDVYELPPVQSPEVEIVQSSNGYWRLKYAGGWITVKRLQ